MRRSSGNTSDSGNQSNSDGIFNRLAELEPYSRSLEPKPDERRRIFDRAAEYVDGFIDTLPGAKAYAAGECERLRELPVKEEGTAFENILHILRDEVDRIGINSASGAGFAYIPGGGIWASSVADMLAAATNRYAGVYFSSPGAVIVENQMIRWLSSLIGYPSTAHGNLLSGGSIANLTAIQTARDSMNVDSSRVSKSVIYTTAHVHHCIHKALHTTGLDDAVHRVVPMNSRYQMMADVLRQMVSDDENKRLRPFLVIASAGTTDTGAIDPLEEIADICEEHRLWFHVDAAYGGFFMLVDELKPKFKGIERSDSVVVDPHKGMFLPFGIGAVLVRDASRLIASYSHQAPYMQDALGYEEMNPADTGPELSKHFRGLRMWLPLHLHGVSAFKAGLEEKSLLSMYFHLQLAKMGFETGPEPELSVSLFRFPARDRDDFNRRLLESIRNDGRVLFSSTIIDGEFWIRCAILNFRTHKREVDLALQVLDEKVRALGGKGQSAV